ncbi:hypothetical protein PHIM7_15 [Sinorhizobium phage phiM7]|uniref:Uncharacterized protein n=3 Tax=Emdodecavirus TaxID=1980937 RepID=S5MUY5_9CAUD|nr:hypothetical protein AB690_gp019 [Sinorhizobium phage phiM12]YP_009212270.1 hypothetical protein AVT40_gp030 [Sinorhizobium phage phiN3]YP_009601140.1 hypothetical protein FDH46_gp015 [Sinorhizobium phage phiM7]AKF12923.1 hypothetical protein PHIM19_16 [Sinorhizobium phage phiM19]AGR47657.1 hypothetical protein SmphiM12_025 [Sinorhizobium phage phiM12]AKF12563.1 hypothetical protein PHIM7_15 [Sinorhizobium phage phiM7]AKF13295.1 hypothetical protein PHIN3_30 [Sinorhizobium phage phiN3]
MKTRKMYEIRAYSGNSYSRPLSSKLRERNRALKLVKFLRKRHGCDAFASVLKINVA